MTNSMPDTTGERPPASPFWTFSLRLYGRKGVPPACLALQDGSGLDVNVLLFCLYAAREKRALDEADVGAILEATEPWKSGAVVNLRAARVYLRAPAPLVDGAAAEALRRMIKAAELEAERLQQEGLYRTFPVAGLGRPAASASEAARGNAAALERRMNTTFNREALDAILAAFAETGD